MKRLATLLVALMVCSAAQAAMLSCPEGSDDNHRREALGTSAPEVKVSAATQDDPGRWAKALRPLTAKAIKAAKAQRATNIEDGIEHGCSAPQVYVAQLPNDSTTGCTHHPVTRTGNEGQSFVQVVAVCQYTWSCCSASPASAAGAGYNLEGAVNPKPAAATATPPLSTKTNGGADNVSSAPSTSAPAKPVTK